MLISRIAEDVALLMGSPPPSIFSDETPFTSGFALLVALEVEECAARALSSLPRELWEDLKHIPSDSLSVLPSGEHRLPLPSDFLRLHSLRMSDWEMPVRSPYPSTHWLLPLQESNMKCVAGGPDRPLAFLASDPDCGRILRIFGSSPGASLLNATYLAAPKINAAGEISIPRAAYPETLRLLKSRIDGLSSG